MKIGKKEGVTGAYIGFAALEVVLYVLSGFSATYIIPLALASMVTGMCLRRGYDWASIFVWANGIVTLAFGSSIAYASLRLGQASMVLGFAMVALSVGSIALVVYVSLNLARFRAAER
jgi:hypothetical protein